MAKRNGFGFTKIAVALVLTGALAAAITVGVTMAMRYSPPRIQVEGSLCK